MDTPYLEEFIRRLQLDDGTDVAADIHPAGAAMVTWHETGIDHPLVVVVHERDLAAAVADIGHSSRELWPDSTPDEIGFNLLFVHLAEVIATRDTTEPLRITSEGLQWPGQRRYHRGHRRRR